MKFKGIGVTSATISNVAATMVSGVKVQALQAGQVASVTETSVALQAGVAVPAVNTFISSTDANGGQGYLRKVKWRFEMNDKQFDELLDSVRNIYRQAGWNWR